MKPEYPVKTPNDELPVEGIFPLELTWVLILFAIWWKQRHQLWPQDESTTNKLWGTAEDLRRTTQFLATCGLRV